MKPMLVERIVLQDGQNCSIETPRRGRSVTFNLAESPLGWLHARNMISDRHFVAGEMLRRDYERAALAGRTTMVWDAPPTSRSARGAPSHGAATLLQIDAKRRFDGAIAVAGAGLSDILWRTVCAGESISVSEKALGWPVRAGKLVLTLALDRIAEYYKVE
ncbi:MAG: DUF6456 domain-containing protein [Chakrabartia sp.]